jgi:hypothetical protein
VDNSIAANKHQQLVKGEKKNAGAALVLLQVFLKCTMCYADAD